VIPIGLSGALLPLLFHHLRGETGDLGSVAGRLYSWNTVGSLIGALLGGYILLFWLDLHHVYRLALAALVVGSALLMVLLFRVSAAVTAVFVVLPALVSLWLLPAWTPERLASGLFRKRHSAETSIEGPDAYFASKRGLEFIFHRDGPAGTVSVIEGSRRTGVPDRTIMNNGKSDGNLIWDYPTMSLAALIPALLIENPEKCFVIGLGTGVTVGELAALESVRKVNVAEISQGVIDAAPLFDGGNLNASTNPKVTVTRGDAYRTLMRRDELFDVIVSEPSQPWVAGVEMLFSAEFLEAARDHLAPGGIYAQWMHLYSIDTDTIELVLRTYRSVFSHVSVWYALGSDLLLLGFDDPRNALDITALETRFERPDFAAGFRRVGIESVSALLAHELLPLGTLHAAELNGPLHTLRHPILSHMAARAFFRGEMAMLPKLMDPASARVGSRNSLLRRYAAGSDGSLPESVVEDAALETCHRFRAFECATLLAYWRSNYGAAERINIVRNELRKKPQIPKGILSERILVSLEVLDGGRPLRPLDESKSMARAYRISKMFRQYYHHAVPFDRGVLQAAWDDCDGESCEQARRIVEARIGRLDDPIRKIDPPPGDLATSEPSAPSGPEPR
jgi:hypothetical protein